MKRLLPLFLFLVLGIAGLAAQSNLTTWNPERDAPAPLETGWEFVWGQLLAPSDINDNSLAKFQSQSRPQAASLSWTKHQDGRPDLPPYGFGSYVLKIQVPADLAGWRKTALALEIGNISSAARIFWNGQEIGNFGTPATSASQTQASVDSGLFLLPIPETVPGNTIWLIIQVANFSDLFPGLQTIPRIGSYKKLDNARDLALATTFLICGLFLIMGIYHLFLFLFRREEHSPLYFAAICLLLSIRILVTDHLFVNVLFPGIPLTIIWGASYLTFAFLVIAFSFFVTNLFRYAYSPVLRWVGVSGSILYALLILLAPMNIYVQFMWIFQGFCLLVGLALGVLLVVAMIGRRQHAVLFSCGFFIVLAATVFDIMKTDLLLQSPSLVPVSTVLFVFILALVLSRKSSLILRTSERLNHRLQRINSSMIRFVPRNFLRIAQKPDITTLQLGDFNRLALTCLNLRFRTDATIDTDQLAAMERINRLVARSTTAIQDRGGSLFHVHLDGFEALFDNGVPMAIQAALHIIKTCQEPGMELHIGLHQGPTLLALIGQDQHLEPAIIADAAKTSASLAGLAGRLGPSVLVSASTVQRLRDLENHHFRVIGLFRLDGCQDEQSVVELFDSDAPEIWQAKRESKKNFERAVHLFMLKRYPEAQAAFRQHVRLFPGDGVGRHYLDQMTKEP